METNQTLVKNKIPVYLRSFRVAAWLGWQIESNWTDPYLFFVFSVLKPVSSVLILVFMYRIVSQAGPNSPIYAYIYLGNAFYIYVGAMVAGASFAILAPPIPLLSRPFCRPRNRTGKPPDTRPGFSARVSWLGQYPHMAVARR